MLYEFFELKTIIFIYLLQIEMLGSGADSASMLVIVQGIRLNSDIPIPPHSVIRKLPRHLQLLQMIMAKLCTEPPMLHRISGMIDSQSI